MTKSSVTLVLALALFGAPVFGQGPGFLGIRAKKAETLEKCVSIELLAPDGPGENAGLALGDVILSINGVAVDCTNLQKGTPLVPNVMGGERVAFGIDRSGKALEVVVIAGEVPAKIVQAQEEQAKMEAGHAVFQRLVRTQEIFTITTDKDGFTVSGNFTAAEAEALHFYFDKGTNGALFPKSMEPKSQDMYIRFDRSKPAYMYEYVDSTKASTPPKP